MRALSRVVLLSLAAASCLAGAGCAADGDRLETGAPAASSGSPAVSASPSRTPPGAGSSGAVSPTGPVPSPPGPASPTHTPPEAVVPPPPVPTASDRAAKAGTFRGRVVEGVEAGCLVLSTGGTVYNLLGGNRALMRPGESVVVQGVPDPGAVTTCQQGTPLRVTSVRPA